MNDRTLYKEAYDKCNAHLIESDKKRDQLVTFYISLTGIFFALNTELSDLSLIFSLALAILGLILSCIIVQFRKWHIRYINSARVLNDFILNPEGDFVERCKVLRDFTFSDIGIVNGIKFSTKFIKRYLNGVEFLTFQAFLVIAFVPIHIILNNFDLFLPHYESLTKFLILLPIFLIFINSIALITMYFDFRKNTPYAKWVLPIDIDKSLYTA